MRDTSIIGYAARLPGANNVEALWRVLQTGMCTLSDMPDDRWGSLRFAGGAVVTPGRTITRRAGLLEDIWSFDAGRFNISPREAEQMDPQQRLLLEVVAEAFDHAGIDPGALDKARTGVFVGASSADHSALAFQDPTVAASHFMLGNVLSILANRISFAWDLRGPSVTIDTACSSSLVALDQARAEIDSGRIDTAVVAGVNLLLSPIPFVGFSQAGMLSPSGLCSPFGARADGYVRAEGAIVFILQRASVAREAGLRIRAHLVGTGVNTAGRGTSITVPSGERQAELIGAVLESASLSAEDIVYLEAHGTGTPVGDPIEAWAIGTSLGQRRANPLPIGSVKSNIGHLEPASGLAGLLKAQLILEHGYIPATIHADSLNPGIDFAALGLSVVREGRALDLPAAQAVIGINSFGFGGVNAHALLRGPEAPPVAASVGAMPPSLMITAPTKAGLVAQVDRWRTLVADPQVEPHLGQLVANANWNRARHRHRLCLAAGEPEELREQLRLWAAEAHLDSHPLEALGHALPVAFVFAGNGAVWDGMARHNYQSDPVFRDAFEAVSADTQALGGPDLARLLHAPDLATRLAEAATAQPLHFAIQLALCKSLSAHGLEPAACLGHSLGEVAAAVVAGLLPAETGMQIVLSRANAFETLRGTGTMAAFSCGRSDILELIGQLGLTVDLAAENAPGQVTVSGPTDQIETLIRVARRQRVAGKRLALPYPYHSRAVRAIEGRLSDDLGGMTFGTGPGTAAFYSGCLGQRLDQPRLDADYWTKNAVEPVAFRAAVEQLCRDGFRLFLEISPQTTVASYVALVLDDLGLPGRAIESLGSRRPEQRGAGDIARRVLAAGGDVQSIRVLGQRQPYLTDPPSAPFERKRFRLVPSRGPDIFGRAMPHPLLGGRTDAEANRWRSFLSLDLQPWLEGHKVQGRAVLPATAIVEMFVAAADDVLGATAGLELRDLELLRPLEVPQEAAVEVLMNFEPAARRLTLSRHTEDGWAPVAVARVFTASSEPGPVIAPTAGILGAGGLYEGLRDAGLDYGPDFALVEQITLGAGAAMADLRLIPPLEGCRIDPRLADAGLHALAPLIAAAGIDRTEALVPGRIGRVRVFSPGPIRRVQLTLCQASAEGVQAEVAFCDPDGRVLLWFEDLRLRPLPKPAASVDEVYVEQALPLAGEAQFDFDAIRAKVVCSDRADPSEADLLRAAIAARLAWDIVAQSRDEGSPDTDLALARAWLSEQGYLERGAEGSAVAGAEGGAPLLQDCPWPPLSVLIPAIAETDAFSQAEAMAALARLAPPATLRGRIDPLPRLLDCAGQLERALPPCGRIALAGAVPKALVELLLDRGLGVSLLKTGPDVSVGFDPVPGLHLASIDDLGLADRFDVIIGVALTQVVETPDIGRLARRLVPGGLFLSLEEAPDLFALLTRRHSAPDVIGRTRAILEQAGLEIRIEETQSSEAVLLLSGRRTADRCVVEANLSVQGQGQMAEALRACSVPGAESRLDIVVLDPVQDPLGLDIPLVLRTLPKDGPVWLISPDPERFALLTGWRRTAVNETGRDLRLLCAPGETDPARLVNLMLVSGEVEILVAGPARSPRLLPLRRRGRAEPRKTALRLSLARRNLALDGLHWQAVPRREPGAHEVEIAVEATGLNFRDVMWGQGLIPPESLEGGFAGPGFGMECAGRILRAGPDSGLSVGQKVAAFAPNAFASHVTVPAHVVLPLPESIDPVTAAALPVVFLTADYALRELARLDAGETVLVHGGAGGVGLAAIQIVRALGARVFATAGTPAKRRYLEMLGVERTFDSRSLDFDAEVLEATGGAGVDVVLNSLAGEALERGLACLAPFGRFIELGKRDIYANSVIALRVFRNNLSFLAVDVDQLLRHRPETARHVMQRLAEGLSQGTLTPPPVLALPPDEIREAFRLMQRSAHVGKIVVRAPAVPTQARPATDLSGHWLITGGTRGFGLATAEWLIRQGATDLWLVSRSGQVSAPDLERLAGARVHLRAVDITDGDAVDRLAAELQSLGGQLDGIVHAAGIIADGRLETLNEAQICSVLAPKLLGALHLDRLAERLAPRHFWLFGSVAARFGNPGQAPYAAANRALEALAEARHSRGLPGLAIAWGPIADTGMLTEDRALLDAVSRKLGTLLTAAESLNRLQALLDGGFDGASATIAAIDWPRLAKDIPVLSEPLFAFIPRQAALLGEHKSLADMIAALGEAKARQEVGELIMVEMAKILRCAPSEIDLGRPMTEIGFDSLMAMNLKMAVEERLGLDLPIQALATEMTPGEFVRKLFDRVSGVVVDDVADYMEASHLTETALDPELRAQIIAQSNGALP